MSWRGTPHSHLAMTRRQTLSRPPLSSHQTVQGLNDRPSLQSRAGQGLEPG